MQVLVSSAVVTSCIRRGLDEELLDKGDLAHKVELVVKSQTSQHIDALSNKKRY